MLDDPRQITEKLPMLTVVFNNEMWGAVKRNTREVYPDGYAAKILPTPSTVEIGITPHPTMPKITPADEPTTELRARIDARLQDLQNALAEPPSEHQAVSYASA